jgi:hypothetical protein
MDTRDWNTVDVVTDPPPCPECIRARQRKEHEERMTWEGEVMIHKLYDDSSIPGAASSAAGSSDASAASSLTSSGRPRRAAAKSAGGVKEQLDLGPCPGISSKTTLGLLKIMLAEALTLAPGQQDMFFEGRKLLGDDRTLGDLSVPIEAHLYVRRNPDGDDDWGASGFVESKPRVQRREEGFAGSALSSGPPRAKAAAPAAAATAGVPPTSPKPAAAASPPSPAAVAAKWNCGMCTFENEGAERKCTMCGSARS